MFYQHFIFREKTAEEKKNLVLDINVVSNSDRTSFCLILLYQLIL